MSKNTNGEAPAPKTAHESASADRPAWLINFSPRPDAKIRLICAHHAGGSAQYFEEWPSLLPQDFEVLCVNLPGRGNRRREDFARELDTVVALADLHQW